MPVPGDVASWRAGCRERETLAYFRLHGLALSLAARVKTISLPFTYGRARETTTVAETGKNQYSVSAVARRRCVVLPCHGGAVSIVHSLATAGNSNYANLIPKHSARHQPPG